MQNNPFFPNQPDGWTGPPVQRPVGSWDPTNVAPVPSTKRAAPDPDDTDDNDDTPERGSIIETTRARFSEILDPDSDDTGEQADLLRRALARTVDGVLVVFVGRFLATMFLTMIFGHIGYLILVPFLMILGIVYETVITLTVGATVGKTVTGIEITSQDDSPLDWQRLATRTVIPTFATVTAGAAAGMLNLPGTTALTSTFPAATIIFAALSATAIYACVAQNKHNDQTNTTVTRT